MIPENPVLRKTVMKSHKPPNLTRRARTVLSHMLLIASFIAAKKKSKQKKSTKQKSPKNGGI